MLPPGGIDIGQSPLEQLEAEIKRLLPVLKKNGGYIFSSDHSVPETVSLTEFRHIINLAKEWGSYH